MTESIDLLRVVEKDKHEDNTNKINTIEPETDDTVFD